MKIPLVGIAILLLSAGAAAGGIPRISIPDLLRPETRTKALRDFCETLHRQDPTADEPGNFKVFRIGHSNIMVSRLRRSDGPSRYLVTWQTASSDDWNGLDNTSMKGSLGGQILAPDGLLYYEIFDAQGEPRLPPNHIDLITHGLIADVKGDGEPQIVREETSSSNGQELAYLTIESADQQSKPTFGILYNTHPTDHALGNAWSFQLRRPAQGGAFEIQLGPVLAPNGVDPKVIFRWDASRAAWIGPDRKAGDHFRALEGPSILEEAERIAREGGLGYPLAESPHWAPLPDLQKFPFGDDEAPPASRLSHPYENRSLAKFSHADLLANMCRGQTLLDYYKAQLRKVTEVPNFWTLNPRAAALEYITKNRPSPVNARYLISIPDPSDAEAPEEGQITLSDGADLFHLYVYRKGSFLLFAGGPFLRMLGGPLALHPAFAFRKIDVSFEDARHVLQTVWWMSKARSRPVTHDDASREFPAGSITDLGYITVTFVSHRSRFTLFGEQMPEFYNTFLGLGNFDSYEYSGEVFANLVGQFFSREIPERLGEPWKASLTTNGWQRDGFSTEPGYTPAEMRRFKAATTEVLGLFRKQKLPVSAVTYAVKAVGVKGWRDLRGELEKVATILPPRPEAEKRLAKLDSEIKRLSDKLAPVEASRSAHFERAQRRAGPQVTRVPVIPGLEPISREPDSSDRSPPGTQTNPKALTPEEEKKFNKLDSLIDERDRVEMSDQERDLCALRAEIATGLRELELFNDAEALLQWATKEDAPKAFIVSRLVALDSKRADEFLRWYEGQGGEVQGLPSAGDRAKLERGKIAIHGADGKLIDPNDEAAVLAVLQSERTSPVDWQAALDLVAPTEDPRRFPNPAIDAALLNILHRGKVDPYDELRMVASCTARRMGGKAWEALVDAAAGPNLTDVLVQNSRTCSLRNSASHTETSMTFYSLFGRPIRGS